MTSSPKPLPVVPELDTSLTAWLMNTGAVMKFPITILSMAGLLVIGTFVEIAPRKSLEFLNNTLGSCLFFILPLVIANYLDWSTGLVSAVVSLVVFARLQKEDGSEGFSDDMANNSKELSTKVVSNPHRWFVERVLGEEPVAISSDRIVTSAVQNEDTKASSSSSSHNK
jgi:predicted membrane protein